MNLRELHQQIGRVRQTAAPLAQRLEVIDRIAEAWLHPLQADARCEAAAIRAELRRLYTRLHHLEARLPTADTLGESAFRRALALGLEIEAAEGARVKAYREARALQLAA